MNRDCAVILAGGEGTRMKSNGPKALCEVLFTPMIDWVIRAVRNAGIEDICVITGFMSEKLCDHLDGTVETRFQQVRLGTGHAVIQAEDFIKAHSGGNVLILNSDTPLIDDKVLTDALNYHIAFDNSATVITSKVDEPGLCGRIVRSENGQLERIVEHYDATEEEKAIKEINSGAFWFKCDDLFEAFSDLADLGSETGKIRLPDVIEIMLNMRRKADAFVTEDADIVRGAENRYDLMLLNEIARAKVIKNLLLSGVDIPCSEGVIISPDSVIGKDTEILPGTIITGGSIIGSGCVIGPNSKIEECRIGDGCIINATQCEKSVLRSKVKIGPYSHVRPGSVIGANVKIGNFVEIKNSEIGAGTSVSHLTYIGDSNVGKGVNFGCGCATANYDGTAKFRTIVGDNAFIGCDTTLVAPVKVGKNAYTAAGSVVTKEVPDGTMAIARSYQVNKRKVRKYHDN